MKTGIVKWFNENKGYGFISPDDETPDVFVHYSAVDNYIPRGDVPYDALIEGERVEFESLAGPKGPQASKVLKLITPNSWRSKECYYVSVFDQQGNNGAGRLALIAGPFKTHQEALDTVNAAQKMAEAVDPRGVWYAYGTVKTKDGQKDGMLNQHLGIEIAL